MIRKIGVVAVAIAIGGLAIAPAAPAASATQQVKKLKKKVSSLEARLAALEARPAGGSPTGTAGGELSGSYPNPTIGTVNGLQLALSDSTSPGIVLAPGGAEIYNVASLPGAVALDAPGGFSVFGTSNLTGAVSMPNATTPSTGLLLGSPTPATLYQGAAQTLRTDGSLVVDGNVVLGDSVGDVATVSGFLRLRTVIAAPAGADCDDASEQGRMLFESNTDKLYVCDGAGGWRSAQLS